VHCRQGTCRQPEKFHRVTFATAVRYRLYIPAHHSDIKKQAEAHLMLVEESPQIAHDEFLRDRRLSLAVLFASSLLATAWTFVSPPQALLALVINAAAPRLRRRGAGKATNSR
jgi:hypothetical protein